MLAATAVQGLYGCLNVAAALKSRWLCKVETSPGYPDRSMARQGGDIKHHAIGDIAAESHWKAPFSLR
jgi:hypothetical protein